MIDTAPQTPELLDVDRTCALLGNIHRASLYRGIKRGRFPAPVHIGPGTSRWLKHEVLAAIQAMAAERDHADHPSEAA